MIVIISPDAQNLGAESPVFIIGSGYIAQVFARGCQLAGVRVSLVTDRVSASAIAGHSVITFGEFKRRAKTLETTTLIHASGPGRADVSSAEADAWFDRQRQILEGILSLSSTNANLVLVSSGGTVYGDYGTAKVSEDFDLLGATPYAQYQKSSESLYADAIGDRLTVLRVGNPYGSLQLEKAKQGFVSAAVKSSLLGLPLAIFGEGEIVRDYFCEDDLYHLLAANLRELPVGVFNIGSGSGVTQNQIVEEVERCTQLPIRRVFLERRPVDIDHVVLDCTRAREQLNWTPRIALGDGIAMLARCVRDRSCL